jgi:hypothetical protein
MAPRGCFRVEKGRGGAKELREGLTRRPHADQVSYLGELGSPIPDVSPQASGLRESPMGWFF